MTEQPSRTVGAGHWFLIDGVAHLFLNNPGPRPVCAVEAPQSEYVPLRQGDPVCPECDTYLREVWMVQVG